MKIAVLSPFFWPEPISTGKYNTLLAEALSANGHDVDIYCSQPFYPEWEPFICSGAHPEVLTVRGGANIKYSQKQVLRRLKLEMWYLAFIFRHAVKQRNRYDLLVSVYPPVFFGFVARLFIPKQCKSVIISHDIQGILATQRGRPVRALVAKIMRCVEKAVYRKADHVIFLSESMRRYCIDKYKVRQSKTSVHYPFEDISGKPCTNDLDFFSENGKRIVYSGALGEKQAPDKIVELFQFMVEQDPEIECYIFSSGPKFEQLKKCSASERIIFRDLVPLANLRELLERSTIQLVPQEIGTADAVLPSKVPNILVAGCAVVAITDPGNELEEILGQVDHSMIFHRWDYELIFDAVVRYYAEAQFGKAHDDEAGRGAIQGVFDVHALVRALESLAGCRGI